MKKESKSKQAKRIAIVAPDDKRKEIIEWSYFNRDVLSDHDLIATHATAGLLEGTVQKPVFRLMADSSGGHQHLATLIKDNKVDVILFFENPMRSLRPDNSIRKLLDVALEMNVVIAGDRSDVGFMKATI